MLGNPFISSDSIAQDSGKVASTNDSGAASQTAGVRSIPVGCEREFSHAVVKRA